MNTCYLFVRRVMVFLALFICLTTHGAAGEDFVALLKSNSKNNPGLQHLARALENFDYQAVLSIDRELKTIVEGGWKGQHPAVSSALNQQGAALAEAVTVAYSPNTELPPIELASTTAPVPNFLEIQSMFRLIAADARRQEASGQLDGAAQRACELLVLSEIFRGSDQQFVVTRLIGLMGRNQALDVLESLLQNHLLSPNTSMRIGAALYAADYTVEDLADKIMEEFPGNEDVFKMRLSYYTEAPEISKALRQNDPSTFNMLVAAKNETPADLESQLAAVREILRTQFINTAKGKGKTDQAAALQPVNDQKLKNVLKLMIPVQDQFLIRNTESLARSRCLMALAAIKSGKGDYAGQLIDPFMDAPLIVTERSIYSLGPDHKDQRGQQIFDPTKGVDGAGDIAIHF